MKRFNCPHLFKILLILVKILGNLGDNLGKALTFGTISTLKSITSNKLFSIPIYSSLWLIRDRLSTWCITPFLRQILHSKFKTLSLKIQFLSPYKCHLLIHSFTLFSLFLSLPLFLSLLA